MAKPKKDRRVQYPPSVVYFKPQGIPMFKLEQEILTVDEYEAIRLVDKDGLDQEQAAKRLGVSRATCARIIVSAHKKVAAALTEGKAIRIEGGNFVLKLNRYRCMGCGALWEGWELCVEVEPLSMHGMRRSLGSRAHRRDDEGKQATFVSEVPQRSSP
jgi:predicted DNA-binding protein (UPF0251 family)